MNTRRHDPTADELKVDRSRTVLQIAVNLVFGIPFLWGLLVAVRGRVMWQSHRIFGDGIGRSATSLWIMVAATGAMWLGVSLMLRSSPREKFAGLVSSLVALALLFGHRLVGP